MVRLLYFLFIIATSFVYSYTTIQSENNIDTLYTLSDTLHTNSDTINISTIKIDSLKILPIVSLEESLYQIPPDTTFIDDELYSYDTTTVSDSIFISENAMDENDKKMFALLLEQTREHYLTALQAQAEGDTATALLEFDEAVKILDAISEYSESENNPDFNELAHSVIDDYQKIITATDSLGFSNDNSLFALRSKLNLDIETIDISNFKIPQNLITGTAVPFVVNEYVERSVLFFMTKGRSYMEQWIYRSGKYFPTVKKIFAEENVPEELIYLSMPESGLNLTIRSRAKAIGMWQFMKGTGAMYGLKGNSWYDERRDFEKSTRAAARLLKNLYKIYDDWYLAIAAYNSGGGRINKGIRKSKSRDFWAMRKYLPRETRNYVPQYLAVTMIAMKPEVFGFANVEKADTLRYEYVSVSDCVDLETLAQCADTTTEFLKELNSELTQWCTPPNYKDYQLKIPVGKKERFIAKYSEIPEEKKQQLTLHKVKRGETISSIAKKYGLVSSMIAEVNRISRKKRLSSGMELIIPIQPKRAQELLAAYHETEKETIPVKNTTSTKSKPSSKQKNITSSSVENKKIIPQDKIKIIYTVKVGETLGHLAEWFGTRATDIRNWNNIRYGKPLVANKTIVLWVAKEKEEYYKKIAEMSFEEKEKIRKGNKKEEPKTVAAKINTKKEEKKETKIVHTVKRGETLEKIAKKYDTSIADLKKWNTLKKNNIKIGDKLEIVTDKKM